jgi:hypothetical protein
VGPGAGLDRCGKSHPTGIRSPDLPAHRESLYRLSYPGSHMCVCKETTRDQSDEHVVTNKQGVQTSNMFDVSFAYSIQLHSTENPSRTYVQDNKLLISCQGYVTSIVALPTTLHVPVPITYQFTYSRYLLRSTCNISAIMSEFSCVKKF